MGGATSFPLIRFSSLICTNRKLGEDLSIHFNKGTETAMASADLLEELNCSICLGIYTDPVTLRCGHNFCRGCIDRVLDTQERSREYSCPECREDFQERPALRKNTTLNNIAQRFLSAQPEVEQGPISCTYCIQSSVPAVKSCLLCEASLCESHLKVHSKSPEHVLSEPTINLGSQKCSIHKKILEYYCIKDAAFICVSCRLDGDHKGHKIKTMIELSDEKKNKSRQLLSNLTTRSKETEKSIQRLQEHKRKIQQKVDIEVDKATMIFRNIKRQLEDQEKKVLSEVYRQGDQVSLPVTQRLKQLEMKKEELSCKMDYVTKLCNMADPFNVLQEKELDRDSFHIKDDEREDVGDLDIGLISRTLNTGLSDFIAGVKKQTNMQEALDISLDVNTACEDIDISGDLSTISRSEIKQYHPERFEYYPQALSIKSFSSGQHCWEVETSDSGNWRIGVSYASIGRRGDHSYFGENSKSWCLRRYNINLYSVLHDSKEEQISHKVSCDRLRICLDYEAGRLSFFELTDPVTHLHTFTATFSEPLHAAFCVWDDWVRILK
ncbi:E3 ubiquitin/ISG15 ligase TRIM25-like isoform X2 [Hyla sarda]|uniref:E3 ubiquitin/ISG15 ligase TRIM25-like isoform X2 n=1 Tax=Hyla sarda TaxID=327740 RepID=UPI0024C20D00|nr:E3 ubiquitin/ISG15 ligase TRIM25-like isoform X2 [Hyla sarda]